MLRMFVCTFSALVVSVAGLTAAEIKGKLKSVDADKSTLTLTVGQKEEMFQITGATKLILGDRVVPQDQRQTFLSQMVPKRLAEGGILVTITTAKRDDKDVVAEVKFSPTPAEIEGKVKSVDVKKSTLTIVIGGKDRVFEITKAAKLLSPGGAEVSLQQVENVVSQKGVIATITTEKKDDKEVVTKIQFRPAEQESPEKPGVSSRETGSRWVEPTREEPPGTKYKTYHSRTINGPASYLLYLPPDYDRETTKRYPVLYWLPGGGLNQLMGRNMVKIVDDAIRAGKIPPFIMVVPHGPSQSMWTDSFDGKEPVETVVIKDLVPHVDQTYRTIARREARWIEGYSIGGRGSAHLGFEYPELFGAVSILAGGLMDVEFFAKFSDGIIFKQVCSEKREHFDRHDPYKLVEKNADAIRGKTLVRIMVGDKDTMGNQVPGYTCVEANRQFHKHLDRLKIPHDYTSRGQE